ncbi:conserved hypothetical protein [Altererythrobacter sp. B11]|uniref:uroporphyrinogen-III synthase n=1 Tax=Altererythrobacter sp. B11 TaxID=2060312 RepID=UPI000DC71A30|nr:uroporphyrinogen-III synthase [Altererythrobacter sp. B11]BBC72234.1 conserved hypothetical protein [Altererythrobacter sp. B11]
MSRPIIAIRPEPGCTATVEAGEAAGLAITGCPLFEIRPLPWSGPPAEQVDALLLGSANAIRHGSAALAAYRAKPVYAVGETTAAAAQSAGFPIAALGHGGLQTVLAGIAPPLRLLRVAGAEHVTLQPPAGVGMETRIAYESVALPLPLALAERLRRGALVLLHSAAAARHFATECDRAAVSRSSVALAALGPRILQAAGSGWGKAQTAPEPKESALLALAHQMCHEPGQF